MSRREHITARTVTKSPRRTRPWGGRQKLASLVLDGVLRVLSVVLDVLRGGRAFLLDGAGRVRRSVLHRLGGLLRGFIQVLHRVLGYLGNFLLKWLRLVLHRHRDLLFLLARRDERGHHQSGTEGDEPRGQGV